VKHLQYEIGQFYRQPYK